MRRIVEEMEGQGLESLLGEQVLVFCAKYIYTGKLVGVNTDDIELKDASIVYETGPLDKNTFTDAQKFPPGPFFVRTGAIESYRALR